MNTCPKCGAPQVEEHTNYAKETGRTWWVCGTFQTRDCHPHHSELCLEREEKNTLQRKVEELQIHIAELEETLEVKTCTKRENLYAVNEASCKTVAHFAVENGNDPIDPSAEPIPKANPDWAVKEGYWYEQYQLMRERYHKQMGENSKQAERSRQLEEQLQAKHKEVCELKRERNRLIDDLQASTIHSCGDSCSCPMCVLRREMDAYKEALKYVHSICEDKTISLHPDDDAKATIDECIMEAERAMQKDGRRNEMTYEQINMAIAESCGWRFVDYCGDLNNMWAAETYLTPDQQVEFAYQLSEIVAPITGDPWMLIHASAFARAKAFLRTVGKWKEAQ